MLDTTAFRPVDTAKPDQPADHGTITTQARGTQKIVNAVAGGIHDGRLFLGADLPVRTGTDGWVFLDAHIVDGPAPAIGGIARIDVDLAHRAALSLAHTACHLAALALDAALATAWSEPVSADALDNPAFDSLAIRTSRISSHRSVDIYRMGKFHRPKDLSPVHSTTSILPRITSTCHSLSGPTLTVLSGSNEAIPSCQAAAPKSASSLAEAPISPRCYPRPRSRRTVRRHHLVHCNRSRPCAGTDHGNSRLADDARPPVRRAPPGMAT